MVVGDAEDVILAYDKVLMDHPDYRAILYDIDGNKHMLDDVQTF